MPAGIRSQGTTDMINSISAIEPSPHGPKLVPASSNSGLDALLRQDEAEPRSSVQRWSLPCSDKQHRVVSAGEEEIVILVALEAATLRVITDDDVMLYDGVMAAGMTCICMSNRSLLTDVSGPADFLQLHIKRSDVRRKITAVALRVGGEMLPRDGLVHQLALAMLVPGGTIDELSAATLAEALALRSTQIVRPSKRVTPLAKSRLRQVFDFIAANLAKTILIDDMAGAAGLSRSQFAAQFRLSTGCTPHEFVLLQRIEAAKRMLLDPSTSLIETALAVGFQSQAHFSTVFKHFEGETPGRWRKDGVPSLDGELRTIPGQD
jgi:AraC family transcriptional regulator